MNNSKKFDNYESQNILIVEDELDSLEIMQEIFEPYFSKVFIARNGYEALDIFEDENIDVILCDMKMPKMDGITTINKIREKNHTVPIVVLSAFSDSELLLAACNLNIQGYVLKPVSIDEVSNILKKINSYQNQNGINVEIAKLHDSVLVDFKNHQLLVNSDKVSLAKKELQFLELLVNNRGQIVPYEMIENIIWHDNNESMSSSSLRTLVKNIRKKLIKEDIIYNISKVGYKII